MYLLGCDIGSSSVKASIVDASSGLTIGADFYPKEEAPIKAVKPGWAEQEPDDSGNRYQSDRYLLPDARTCAGR